MPKANNPSPGLVDTWGRKNRKLKDKKCKQCKTMFRPRGKHSMFCCQSCAGKHNGAPFVPKKSIEQHIIQFWQKVNKSGPVPDYKPELGPCWLWMGRLRNGYGQYVGNSYRRSAHQMSYTLMNGAIPAGLEIDHLCRVKRCVNPSHLEAVTHRENVLRGTSPIAANAKKTHCPKGHALEGYNLMIQVKGERTCRICKNASDLISYHKHKILPRRRKSTLTAAQTVKGMR